MPQSFPKMLSAHYEQKNKESPRAAWCWNSHASNKGEQAVCEQKHWAKWSSLQSGSTVSPCRAILQDLAGKLLQSTAVDRKLILCPGHSPIATFQMAFSCGCLVWSQPSSLPPMLHAPVCSPIILRWGMIFSACQRCKANVNYFPFCNEGKSY